MVSLTEKCYIHDGIKQNIRADGRTRLDYRYITYNYNVLPHTQSSIRLHIGNTDILCTTSVELVTPIDIEHMNHGMLQFNVHSTLNAYPIQLHHKYTTQTQINDTNNTLQSQLTQIYNNNNVIDLTQLCVIENQTVWCIYIDYTVLCSDGSLIDALSIATYCVLKHLLLPKVEVITNDTTQEKEINLLQDEPGTTLQLDNMSLILTLSLFDTDYIIDCTGIEESVSDNSIVFAVNHNGTIQAILSEEVKHGLTVEQLKQLRHAARTIGKQLHSTVNQMIDTVKSDNSTKPDRMHIEL